MRGAARHHLAPGADLEKGQRGRSGDGAKREKACGYAINLQCTFSLRRRDAASLMLEWSKQRAAGHFTWSMRCRPCGGLRESGGGVGMTNFSFSALVLEPLKAARGR